MKYLGNGLEVTGSRAYQIISHGKDNIEHKLLTWSQRRCKKCQRFLSKKEIKLCKRCYNKLSKLWHFERDTPTKQYSLKSIENFIEVSIPIWLREELKRGYL
jgi:hypothetical protein